jgi:hypothetical protein
MKDPQIAALAYEDQKFLAGEDGRPVRILSEYLGPLHRFRAANVHDTIVFFGSAELSSDGPLRGGCAQSADLTST